MIDSARKLVPVAMGDEYAGKGGIAYLRKGSSGHVIRWNGQKITIGILDLRALSGPDGVKSFSGQVDRIDF